ncbi:MAG TPA: branched-chain amino acid ABC transporter permease [Syntrophorhabdales bacterium]|nr:branched-chain amino acid ABC transporter permease [Syntrophorhabdales bacterium]
MADNRMKACAGAAVLALLVFVPLVFDLGSRVMNVMVTLFIYVILAQGWNVIGGYTGQVNLGIVAFFGVSTMVTHFLWKAGVPIYLAISAGTLSAVVLAVLIGLPTLRLRGMYFAVGTLALAQAAQTIVGNIFTRQVSMPGSFSAQYSLSPRYYLGLALACASIGVVYVVARSKVGLAMVALRDDEEAARVTGVRVFRYKVTALMISAALAGLAGGLYGYVRLSFWQISSVFSPSWTFDALLSVVVGGAGTLFGPVVGSVFLVVLSEVFANTLGQAHLIIFGFVFILVVLFLPQGLMGGVDLLQRQKTSLRPETERESEAHRPGPP